MTTSRCGLLLPLPVTFDLDAHTRCPDDIACPSSLNLQYKNIQNVCIEKANKISIGYTQTYAEAVAAGNGPGVLDAGVPLRPSLKLMLDSKEVVEAVCPLPLYMTVWLAEECKRRVDAAATLKNKCEQEHADHEAEKVKALHPIVGMLLIQNPHIISSTVTSPAPIPTVYHTLLAHKVYLPLHWWSDKVLHHVDQFPHTFPTDPLSVAQITLLSSSANHIINVMKAMKDLGDEDEGSYSPGLWHQSSLNQLDSFCHLCPAIVPRDPSSPKNMFAKMIPVWYSVEHRLRYAIFGGGLFNPNFEQMRMLGLMFVLALLVTSLVVARLKRPAGDEGDAVKTSFEDSEPHFSTLDGRHRSGVSLCHIQPQPLLHQDAQGLYPHVFSLQR
ncbi:hypothetical protein B0H10DRAFT_1944000 [Mycena sp. CBHHK59/15]|nr:hypothetical protein B0H10DRAFT_1944000 [Mycena sp. CBHHK59/15]